MPPACLQATVVEVFCFLFCFSQLKFPLFKMSYLVIGSSWQKSGQHSPSLWEHKGLATWSKSNFVQLRVCEHSQCPNNVTHGYLSKRNQSPFKTCMQMRSVSILLAKAVSKTNIHWWRDKSKVATKNKTKTNPKSLMAREQDSEIKDKRGEEAPYLYYLSPRTHMQYSERSWTKVGKRRSLPRQRRDKITGDEQGNTGETLVF